MYGVKEANCRAGVHPLVGGQDARVLAPVADVHLAHALAHQLGDALVGEPVALGLA